MILFLLDIWVGDTSLTTRFSEPFGCEQNKKVAVADYMDRVGDQAVCGPIFGRNFTDIELQFQALFSYLGNVTNVYIPMDGKDRLMDIFQLALPLISREKLNKQIVALSLVCESSKPLPESLHLGGWSFKVVSSSLTT